MKNLELSRIFYEIADLLDLQEEAFKPEAYRRAARTLESMSRDVEEVWRAGELDQLPGVGKAIGAKIEEYLETGIVAYHERLKAEIPPGVVAIMKIPGVGPKTAKRFYQELGLTSVEELKAAAAAGRIQGLKGLGPKKVENILRGIELKAATAGRTLLGRALPRAESIVDHLRGNAPVSQIVIGGSLRRRKETVGDIDLLATAEDHAAVMEAFVAMPIVREVLLKGDTKSTVILDDGMQADLRVLDDESFGAALQYFTGNKDHNIRLRSRAIDRGLKLNEYGLFRGDERVAGATEEELYAALDLPYIEPELRQDQGEFAAAAEGTLPHLVTEGDIQGDLHVHSNWSDGQETPEAMVTAAEARGYAYVGLSDHSQSLRIARGMTEETIRNQMAEIAGLRKRWEGIEILHGSEVDILEDGRLDYPDSVLRDLDYAIAAVHSRFSMSEKEMTSRVLTALANDHVRILAHPTCRRIGEREPVSLDLPRVMEAAADSGTALELNAFPERLDLNGAHARMAREAGAMLIINTDSHAPTHLAAMRYGVGQARRGWIEAPDLLNARSVGELRQWLEH